MAAFNKLSVPLGRPKQEGQECSALIQADCPRRPKGELVNTNTAAGGRAPLQEVPEGRTGAQSVNKGSACA